MPYLQADSGAGIRNLAGSRMSSTLQLDFAFFSVQYAWKRLSKTCSPAAAGSQIHEE